jgi:hypothetical protein
MPSVAQALVPTARSGGARLYLINGYEQAK